MARWSEIGEKVNKDVASVLYIVVLMRGKVSVEALSARTGRSPDHIYKCLEGKALVPSDLVFAVYDMTEDPDLEQLMVGPKRKIVHRPKNRTSAERLETVVKEHSESARAIARLVDDYLADMADGRLDDEEKLRELREKAVKEFLEVLEATGGPGRLRAVR